MSSGHESCDGCASLLSSCVTGGKNANDDVNQAIAQSRSNRNSVLKEKEELDRYLASSMAILSVEDRTLALEEVHGAAPAEQEDIALMNKRLEEMESHLTKLKTKGSAYGLASHKNSDYVSDRNLRIMFLRSNRYDSKPAAEQIIKFFEVKELLFGAEKLTEDIFFQDLSADDKKCLFDGSFQLLPNKDSIGRAVFVYLPGLRSRVPIESEARVRFYIFMRTLRKSEETQKSGSIGITYAVQEYRDRPQGNKGAAVIARLATSLPVRWAGMHMCFDDISVRFHLTR